MKKISSTNTAFLAALLALSSAITAMPAFAHTGAKHGDANKSAEISTEEKAVGKQGDPKKVTRTITIDMNDTMRFSPAELKVKQGETIKFVVQNKGKLMHEMVLGTMAELKEHGALMKKNPGMEHDEPYMTHVSPGKKQEMIWQFTKPGDFNYACLVPGHFEAGMIGKIKVVAK